MSNPSDTPTPPRGWYADPAQPNLERYWDGTRWTQVVRRAETIELKNPETSASPARLKDPAVSLPLAGWWRRFFSGVVDTILSWVLTVVMLVVGFPSFLRSWWQQLVAYTQAWQQALVTPGSSWPTLTAALQNSTTSFVLVGGGVMVFYCLIFWGTWGATLGQKMVAVKVIRAPLPLTITQASKIVFTVEKPGWMRSFSKALSWALFSTGGGLFLIVQLVNILMPLWHRRKQSVTDLFANTLVVRSDIEVPEQN